MKFNITFKTMNELDIDAGGLLDVLRPEGLTDEEWGLIRHIREDLLRKEFKKWMTSGKYISIRFDIFEGTAIVVENPEDSDV